MWRRLLMTMATGAALSGAYVAYSVVVSSIVRIPESAPEPVVSSELAHTQRPQENMRVASDWLKDQVWASSARYQLRTDSMFVYANEWQPSGDKGLIHFRPFAAVWLSHDKDGVEQAVTVSAESALLKFESSFEFDNPKPGRVTGGSLDGAVRITGPDGLEILGEDVFFLEGTSSLYSLSPVKFRFGQNRGEAGQLFVRLIKAETPISKDRPNVIGIESVELRQNVRMDLVLDEERVEEGSLTVKCTGRFVYQVERRVATYEQDVVAYRYVGHPQKPEYLQCDRLTLQFDAKSPATAGGQEPRAAGRKSRDEFQKPESNLEFRALTAEGKPAAAGKPAMPVRLRSEPQQLKAWMKQLTYDARERSIVMSSPTGVQVAQQGNRLICPEIRVVLGEDNSISEALCLGTGWFESKTETGEVAFAADWMKQLRKTTDPETQLDLIELVQDASFRQSQRETALGADLIRLWFTPPENESGNERRRFQFAGQGNEALPKRLLALRHVAFVSPKVEYEGEHMEVLFDDGSLSPTEEKPLLGRRERPRSAVKVTARRGDAEGRKTTRRSSAKRSSVGFASVPPEGDDPAPNSGDAPSRPPMEVSADKMRVRILPAKSSAAQPEVAEIWTAGHVRVIQPSDHGGLPIVVTGDRLHVRNNSETDQVVHVFGEPGRPAHLRDEEQQLHLEGQAIGLDRAANLSWVEGAGLLQLPVPKTLDGQDLPEPQILDVWWKEWMDFDGLLATFEGDVKAKLEGGTMQCRTMQVELSRLVSFGEPNEGEADAEVKTITCRDGVEFENHRYQEGQLLSIQKAKVWEFRIDNVTQDAQAQGPGWMQMWRRGNGKRAGLAVTESVQANRISREPPAEWEYTRVDFAGDMKGNLGRKRSTFHDRVEVLYGPVERPVDVINRHELPKDGGWMRCDSLEVAQTAASRDGKGFVQLLGKGNTRLEGRGYAARADEISYDETKGLFVLRSLGNYQATIWRERAPGDQQLRQDAQRMEFNPATGDLRITKSTGGEGTQ